MMNPVISRAKSWWRGLRERSSIEAEIRQELENHLDLRAADLERSGLTPSEARRQARLEFGPVESTREDVRASRGLHVLDRIAFSWLDVKMGMRMLWKHPGMTAVAVFALAIGIPVGLAPMHLASAIEAPLKVPDGDRIRAIRFWNMETRRAANGHFYDLALFERDVQSFEALGATRSQMYNVALNDESPFPAMGAEVTPATFELLHARPLAGRILRREDSLPGASPVVVVGHDLWRSRYGGDPDLVGSRLRIGEVEHEIVGVMPEQFLFPVAQKLWLPLIDEVGAQPGEGTGLRIFGRLAKGVSEREAQAELDLIAQRLAEETPEIFERLRIEVVPFGFYFISLERGGLRAMPEFYVFQVLALLVLLVACSNVAMLMLARTVTRWRELAIRTALGAGRGRVVAQMFVESFVLAIVATGVGLVLVEGLLRLLRAKMAAMGAIVPYWFDLGLTSKSVLWSMGLATLSAVVAGVLPALKVTGRKVQRTLQSAQAGRTGIRFGGVTSALIVADVAIAITALGFAIGMSDRMRDAMQSEDLIGVAAEEYLSVQFHLPTGGSAGSDRTQVIDRFVTRLARDQELLVERLESEPGIQGVAIADALPRMDHRARRMEIAGLESPGPRRGRWLKVARVSPGYFEALKHPVLRGRAFGQDDVGEGRATAIVNTAFIERDLQGRNPIGRQLRFLDADDSESEWFEIVGVVGHLGVNLIEPHGDAAIYLPAGPGEIYPLLLGIHAGPSPEEFVPKLREIAAEIDPSLVMGQPRVLSQIYQSDWYLMLASTAGLVLLVGILVALAASALFAMISFSVTERTREIGVRTALGAQQSSIVLSILRRALAQIAMGAIFGMPLAGLLFFNIDAGRELTVTTFAYTIATGTAVMAAVALLSCVGPSRRVLRIEPSDALRVE